MKFLVQRHTRTPNYVNININLSIGTNVDINNTFLFLHSFFFRLLYNFNAQQIKCAYFLNEIFYTLLYLITFTIITLTSIHMLAICRSFFSPTMCSFVVKLRYYIWRVDLQHTSNSTILNNCFEVKICSAVDLNFVRDLFIYFLVFKCINS